jgi:hypothetical protein
MLLPLLLWCVPATTAQAPAAEDLLASTLAAAREAHGHGELRQASLRASGRSSQFGQQGSYTLELHRDGAFRNQVDSSLPQTLCGDDHQGWQADWSGHRWPLEFLDLERARLFAAVLSGRWLDAEPPLTVTLASESTGAALELRWRGGSELAHLVLSADSQRVERLEVGGQTWHFEDYRDVEGFPFPHRLRSESSTAPTLSYELDAVQRAPDLSAAQVLREPASAADARFDPAVPAALELHRAPTGHLLARARLGADHEGWFILDTGAGALCLSPRAGTELDFPALGAVTAAGVSAAIPARILRGGPLVVGPLTLEHPTWVELDLDFLEPHFGVPV